ncbi:MAG TPA: acetamidase, partial [Lysinibacillus sp.]|nr:acetamidase [Lysinibacillus sp.]
GVKQVEEAFPVSIVGSGKTLNEATDNAIRRASKLFELPEPEVLNRATITGSIEIGRHPGMVTATFQVPKTILKKVRIYKTVKKQYD